MVCKICINAKNIPCWLYYSMSGHRIPEDTSYMYVATKCMVKSLTEGHRRELRADGSNIKVAVSILTSLTA